MKLLALDQASNISGYAIFDGTTLVASGTFTASASSVGNRLVQIRQKILDLVQEYKIEKVVFEDIQMQGGNVQTHKTLAEVFGVIEETAAELKLTYKAVHASSWRSVIGIKAKTRADQKQAAQAYVFAHYNKKVSSDEADAICIGASEVLSTESAF